MLRQVESVRVFAEFGDNHLVACLEIHVTPIHDLQTSVVCSSGVVHLLVQQPDTAIRSQTIGCLSPHHRADIESPDPCGTITRSGEHLLAIRTESHRCHVVEVTFQLERRAGSVAPPDSRRVVSRCRGDPSAIGTEGDAPHGPIMPPQLDSLSAVDRPYLGGSVARTEYKLASIGARGQGRDSGRLCRLIEKLLRSVGLPDPHRIVLRSGDRLAVWCERNGPHGLLVPSKNDGSARLVHWPEPRGLVLRAREYPASVAIECDRIHFRIMTRQPAKPVCSVGRRSPYCTGHVIGSISVRRLARTSARRDCRFTRRPGVTFPATASDRTPIGQP